MDNHDLLVIRDGESVAHMRSTMGWKLFEAELNERMEVAKEKLFGPMGQDLKDWKKIRLEVKIYRGMLNWVQEKIDAGKDLADVANVD